MIEQIDRLIADLDHDIEVLTERRRLATELRATFTTDEPAPEVDVAPDRPKKKAAAKPKKAAAAGGHKCPDCGKVVPTKQGLATHRGRVHKESAAKPVEAVPTPTPRVAPSSEPQVPGKVLRCSCGHEVPNLRSLVAHCSDEHQGRAPTSVERTPVAPRAAAA